MANNRVVLGAAVGLGVLAMILASTLLGTQEQPDRQPPIKVLMAHHDLLPGRALDPEKDFEEVAIPASCRVLADRGLSLDARSSYKGHKINRRILAGTPIMLADLGGVMDLELKAGRAALSVPVKGAQALGGLLVPGDQVKALVTRPKAAKTGDSTQSWETVELCSEPLRILAIGQRLSRLRQQVAAVDQSSAGNSGDSDTSVTLEVTEEQARVILAQTGAGQLPVTLILVAPAAGKNN